MPFEDANLARIREFVAHGLGVALLARSVGEAPGPSVVVHALLPALQRPVGLLHHRTRRLGAAAQACRAFLAGWPVPDLPVCRIER
ncbi:MAG: LysR substrate-binding domain-containing protein [Pseudonocardia sp.]